MSLSVQNSGNLPREVLEEFENLYAEARKLRDDVKQLIQAITTGQGSGLGGFAPPGFGQLPGTPPGFPGSPVDPGQVPPSGDPGGVGVPPSDPPQGGSPSMIVVRESDDDPNVYVDRIDFNQADGFDVDVNDDGHSVTINQANPLMDANVHSDTVSHLAPAGGSLIVANDGNIWDKLVRGTNGQVLTVDTAEALDLKWATPSAGVSPATIVTDVGAAGVVGTDLDYAREDHVHKGVFSHSRLNSSALFGATYHEAGPGLVCYQVGQTVFYALASMASGYVSCANAAAQDITTITFVDITDTGLALSANTSYGFQYYGDLFTSAVTEGGILSVNFSGTLTALSCTVYFPAGSSTPYTFTTNDGGTLQTSGPGAVTPGAFFVYGTIQVGASGGTLMLRGRCETNPPPPAPTFEIQECLTKHVWPL